MGVKAGTLRAKDTDSSDETTNDDTRGRGHGTANLELVLEQPLKAQSRELTQVGVGPGVLCACAHCSAPALA